MHQKEAPVFYDQSGKRWSMAENIIVLTLAILGCVCYWLIPEMLSPKHPSSLAQLPADARPENVSENESRPSAEQLAGSLATKNTAVVGTGPLVRLTKVREAADGVYLDDPFSKQTVQKLSEQEVRFIGDDSHAIQRYGGGEEKRLALTFDDGPDSLYTPRLLDLLSKESVPATFFVTGSSVIQFPDIVKRLTDEGHTVGNHTFSHIDFNKAGMFRSEQEISQTQRLIVSTTNHNTPFFRPPYGGNSDQSLRNSLKGIVIAQELGYTVASYDFNSADWQFPSGQTPVYPDFDGNDIIVLLHDGGGDRSGTLAYVQEIIRRAKNNGYSFASLDDLYSQPGNNDIVASTAADHAAFLASQAAFIWPRGFTIWLFIITLASLVVVSLFHIVLAIFYKATVKYKQRSITYTPTVSIIVPAYNEEKVLEKNVNALLKSIYPRIEILIVDDGSSDGTLKVARRLAKRYTNVRALHQKNKGKAMALNTAISRSTSEIIICVDADTMFTPRTVDNLVRHFEDKTVGAVAGVVKVGNSNSILTKWQALEYISGISIERGAQALLGAITIVPGACGAWRRSVLVEVGGFSNSTLAEDCDLTLKIQATGMYKILQDHQAISYTEAPESIGALTKQRFRWTFGNIQSLWKHRSLVLNAEYGWLGMFALPSIVIATIVPIVFWPLLFVLTIENVLSGNYRVIVLFFILSLAVQYVTSILGIALARERYSLLLAVPFARFIYGPIRVYILYKTLLTIVKGVDVGWNKLARTGTVYDSLGSQPLTSTAQTEKT